MNRTPGLSASETRFAMGSRVGVLFAVVVVLALSSVSVAADKAVEAKKPVAAAKPLKGKVTLTYDSGKSVTCLTRRWADGGKSVSANGSTAKVSIAGKAIPAAGWKSGASYRIGLDANGDGIVNNEEYRKVAPGGSVVLTGKLGGKELSVRCVEVSVQYDDKEGKVRNMRWRMQGVYGWVGQIDSVKIRILDENLDGKYGHDGGDAIQIGNGKLALPLRGRHRIGENFYKLKIEPDGSSMEFTKIPDPKVGMVRSPFTGKYLLGLVLENGSGAYDIQACSRTGIPAGTYNVAYGAVGDPRSPLAFYSTGNTLKYEIQADMKNLIRIGPPLQLVFSADYQETKKDKDDKSNKPAVRKLNIKRPDRIIGAGGERYGPVSFPNARSAKGRPGVMIFQGGKTLAKAVMPERDGKVGDFSWEFPRMVSPRGSRVMMAASIRGLGKVTGVRTIRQIAAKEEFAPPKTDKPSVITTPWKKPAKSTKIAKTPKPPVGLKPKPTTRRSTGTRPAKSPKSASSNEQKAERLLNLAESYNRMKLRSKAIEMLKKAVEKYPDTKAAAAERARLDAME